MPYIKIAPDATDLVAELIREHHRARGGRYTIDHYTSPATVGRFATEGGATVEVRALTRFGLKRYPSREGIVQVGASALCHGHGCVDPQREELFAEAVSFDDGVTEEIAAAVLPLVQAAREWAQAHAEKCRAQPYTGR
ncbi:hypothetical protein ABT390_33990 [Streptomyces aurantiacus]|uniref:Uncharacterized protein n=1 Tax=Streptomyces aurantiacus JA 4570 TaxID=1286094 RepID=S4A7V2_9ACTN|nr:hypothetical protein [Streptomyces aurantiacus]EPH46870.1 hypothetical protein STRAU_0036 [Streptomyces aurantiacus JA 4570]